MGRQIYKGRIVDLRVERVTLPNGTAVDLEPMHHPGASARGAGRCEAGRAAAAPGGRPPARGGGGRGRPPPPGGGAGRPFPAGGGAPAAGGGGGPPRGG